MEALEVLEIIAPILMLACIAIYGLSFILNVLLLMVFGFLMFDGGFRKAAEVRAEKEELQEKGEKRRKRKLKAVEDERDSD